MPKNKKRETLRTLFGRRIKALRLAAKLTQEELSERAAISVDFLSLIERGRNSPSFENIESLALALDLPVSMLFAFDEERR